MIMSYFLEVHFHGGFGVVPGGRGGMDQLSKFVESHPACTEAKNEEQTLD
jgi:hypothetical protein